MKLTCRLAGIALLLVLVSTGQNTSPQPAFDVASVKIAGAAPGRGISQRMSGGPGTSDPGRITFTQLSLIEMLAKAWDIDEDRIVGPVWLKSDRLTQWYTVVATMPPDTTAPQLQLMLQNLLAERFRIKLHHETKPFPAGYELVVASGGPKLTESKDTGAPDPSLRQTGKLDDAGFLVLPPGHGYGGARKGHGRYSKFQSFTMAEFATSRLAGFVQQSGGPAVHIVDKTGLAGKYDFTLKFFSNDVLAVPPLIQARMAAEGAAPPDAGSLQFDDGAGLPDIFKALEKQLGLKLVKVKDLPFDVLVIDHAERMPEEN